MTEIIHLAPHDPLPDGMGPEGPGRQVIVLRRFDEDRPSEVTVQITLTGKPEQTTHLRNPDGRAMALDAAIEAAGRVAAEEGIDRVFVIDRTEGRREQDILAHRGDHSVHMDQLSDTDEEDGVRGSDMRDGVHRSDGA